MPTVVVDTTERPNNYDLSIAPEFLNMQIEEHRMKLEVMQLTDTIDARKHQRAQEAREAEIFRITVENERLQLEENRQQRENDEGNRRRNLEHELEMKRLQMQENNNAREHELRLNRENQETIRLKLESDKQKEELQKLKKEFLVLQSKDNRHARTHKEKMAALGVQKLNSVEEIRRQRLDERKMMTEKVQQQISEENDRREQLERQRRKEKEEDIRSLRNLGLLATGVGAASGAIGGAVGTTAAAVGLAAGVAGAATVLAPLSATIAVASGIGYVYRRATSSRN